MFPTNSLVAYLALALAAAAVVNADGFEANRREHAQLNRMIRKRSPQLLGGDGLGGVIGVGNDVSGVSASVTSLSASSVSASASASASTSETAQSSVVTSASSSSAASSSEVSSSSVSSASDSLSSSATSSSAVSSSSVSSSASSSSVTSSSSVSTTASATKNEAPPPTGNAGSTPHGGSTVHVDVTQTLSNTAAAPTQASAESTGSISKTGKVSLTIVGVIAGSIGGAALIWTIIRKWKFKPSAEFEDRMAPIDWQPTDPNDHGLPGHRRAGSGASSFHSSENLAGRGGAMGYGATSDNAHGSLPDHDFTAGPGGHLAPVGGYADLNRGPSPGPMARGPSPQPQMQQANWDNGPVHAQYGAQDAYNYNGPRY